MNFKKIKHLTLRKLIILLGKVIESNFLRNIFKIIIDKNKFTTVADIFLDKFIRLGIFLLYPVKGVLSEEHRKNKKELTVFHYFCYPTHVPKCSPNSESQCFELQDPSRSIKNEKKAQVSFQ